MTAPESISWERLKQSWQSFWFTEYPPRLLSIYRILFALVFLYRLTNTGRGTHLWYSGGYYHGDVFHVPYLDALQFPPEQVFAALVDARLIFAITLLAGLCTRLSMVIAGAIYIYMFFLNQIFYFHNMYFLCLMCLLGMFMPFGKTLSCDYVVNKVRKKDPPTAVSYWPAKLLFVTVSVIYFVSAMSKTTPDFLSGEILRLSSIHFEGTIFWFFAYIPHSWQAWATICIEYFLAFAFWFRPTRPWAFFIGICFHMMLEVTMNINSYTYQILACYVLFVDPRLRTNRIAFPIGSAWFQRVKACWKWLDWFARFEWVAVQSSREEDAGLVAGGSGGERRWSIVTAENRRYEGFRALRYFLLMTPITSPLGLLLHVPPVSMLSRKMYESIHR